MKIVSIDLATKQTGIAIFEDHTLKQVYTIKQTLLHPYKTNHLKLLEDINQTIIPYLDKDGLVLIEWSSNKMCHVIEKFSVMVCTYLYALGYKVVPMNTTSWMSKASLLFGLKRKMYPNTQKGNKEWIKDLAHMLWPTFEFKSQDEMDAVAMGSVYLVAKSYFLVYKR